MPLETILEPINGEEARKILKSQMEQRIDKIPLLKVGNAFKQIKLGFELIFEAFPADCPVPTAEWQILAGLEDGQDIEFDFDKNRIDLMEEKRDRLEENLKKLNNFIKKYKVIEVINHVESDNGVPDELRVEHKLKLPMLHTSPSGKKVEVMIDSKDIK